MEADAVRRKLHPDGVVSYIIDRNINYTNFCTEYCTFCAFYRPLKGPAAKEGYILEFETIYDKIAETVELGGTGVLMQGGLHPDLKIEWHEKMLSGIRQRFPKVHLHCYSASEILAIAEYSNLNLRDTIARLRDAGLDSIPGGGAEILDDEVRFKIARLKCLTEDWISVHRTAHQLGMASTFSISSFYLVSQRELFPKTWPRALLYLPFLMALGIGLTITNTKAVLEALVGQQSAFARTPKYGVDRKKQKVGKNKYRKRLGWIPWVELLIGCYFASTVYYALDNENYITVPFLLLFVIGYWYTGLMSLLQGRFTGLALSAETHTKPFPVGV